MTEAQMESFIFDLAKLGYCWQFITLAGFHCDALSIDNFAKAYATQGAAAYVQLIQREERKNGVETLTHQKWSGSEIVDEMGNIVSGGLSSTGIMSAGVADALDLLVLLLDLLRLGLRVRREPLLAVLQR